ncbi:MAG: UMP kinase [Gammaproteobacteria bacterium]|nr:MAG: UMP kinase [Gammaproteobacteria bacterium]
MTDQTAYKRVLLKLSGEALMGDDAFGINHDVLKRFTTELKSVSDTGVQMAIVIGGGNLFRGVASATNGMDRPTADYMGMLATVMNALALADALKQQDMAAVVMSGLPVGPVAETYDRNKALNYLNDGVAVIFGAGTGNPFFTTDTAASLRGLEIDADVVFKATKVNGVYDKDPMKHSDAKRYDTLSYDEVLEKRLAVMDATAIALCRDNNMVLRVLSINEQGSLLRAIRGGDEGTIVK